MRANKSVPGMKLANIDENLILDRLSIDLSDTDPVVLSGIAFHLKGRSLARNEFLFTDSTSGVLSVFPNELIDLVVIGEGTLHLEFEPLMLELEVFTVDASIAEGSIHASDIWDEYQSRLPNTSGRMITSILPRV